MVLTNTESVHLLRLTYTDNYPEKLQQVLLNPSTSNIRTTILIPHMRIMEIKCFLGVEVYSYDLQTSLICTL